MDSARDFDLLGELVPQVRVSARTLALCGFFIIIYIYVYKKKKKETLWVSGKYIKKNWRAAGLEPMT